MIFVYGSYFHMKYDGHVLYCMYLYCIIYNMHHFKHIILVRGLNVSNEL